MLLQVARDACSDTSCTLGRARRPAATRLSDLQGPDPQRPRTLKPTRPPDAFDQDAVESRLSAPCEPEAPRICRRHRGCNRAVGVCYWTPENGIRPTPHPLASLLSNPCKLMANKASPHLSTALPTALSPRTGDNPERGSQSRRNRERTTPTVGCLSQRPTIRRSSALRAWPDRAPYRRA